MPRPLIVTVLVLALAGAAQAAGDSPVKRQMNAVVGPASGALFGIAGEVDPANGPDAAKVAAKRWMEAANASASLQKAAVAMQGPGYAKDKGLWMVQAKKMAAISQAATAAAKQRNGAALSQAANDLSDVCSACHAKYRR